MKNIELEAKVNNLVEIAKEALCKRIYLPTRLGEDYEYEINQYGIQCITVEHVDMAKEGLFKVYGDSHSLLKGSYDSEDIGTKLFLDKDIAEKALAGEQYTTDNDTISLKNTFVSLEQAGKNFGNEEVFCVIKDSKTERYQVSVMSIYSILIMGNQYHYRGERNNISKDNPAVKFRLDDEIGSAECILGETCFFDTKQAMEKAKELNRKK